MLSKMLVFTANGGPETQEIIEAPVPSPGPGEVAIEGVDLVIDLVGGEALRDIAVVAKDPNVIVSTADPATVQQLGGSAATRTREGLEKITGVAQYGLVNPHVGDRFSLDRASEAIAAVETGHTTGKVIIEP